MIFGPVRRRIARGWNIIIYSFQRWASDYCRELCVVQTMPILVDSTDHVFAPYWSVARTATARAHTASKGAHSETRVVHVRVHAILRQKSHRKPGERMWQSHRRRVISYSLPTDHSLLWLHKSYETGQIRGSHAYDLSIICFMPKSQGILG